LKSRITWFCENPSAPPKSQFLEATFFFPIHEHIQRHRPS
jgi:hypothetical protein